MKQTNTIYSIFALIFTFLFLVACGSEGESNKTLTKEIDPMTTKRYTEAIKLEEKVRKDPNNEQATVWLRKAAELFSENKQPKMAAAALNKALKIYPNAAEKDKTSIQLISLFDEYFPSSGNADILRKSFIVAYPTHEKAAVFRSDMGTNETTIFEDFDVELKKIIEDTSVTNLKQKASNYITYVELFSLMNPNHKETPDLMNQAADISSTTGDNTKAIMFLDWFRALNPDNEKSADALFKKAFIYDANLKNKKKAKAIYQEFIEKYSKHPLLESAKFMLENIDKTDEETMNALLKKSKK